MTGHRRVVASIGAFVLVLLSLQIFLLTVGLDALLGHEPALAWISAACSLVLGAGSLAFYAYARRGGDG
ncbi:MAG: hypothetical protein K1X95_16195 [Acidimicrobiia bacterium]|nr:hypothetical protein [Acidimicrobiia bacterium]